MLIKKSQTRLVENANECRVREYNLGKKQLGIAKSRITGRYPTIGRVRNTESDEIYLVISGEGDVHIDDKHYKIEKGDALYIEKESWFYVQGTNLEIVAATSPSWNEHQQEKS